MVREDGRRVSGEGEEVNGVRREEGSAGPLGMGEERRGR